MRFIGVVVILALVSGTACHPRKFQERTWRERAQYIELIPAPAEPVSTWDSQIPHSEEEYWKCQKASFPLLPEKRSTGVVDGRQYVVIGYVWHVMACRYTTPDFTTVEYFKYRWDEPVSEDDWIEGECRIDGALKAVQFWAVRKKKHAEAVLNVTSYCDETISREPKKKIKEEEAQGGGTLGLLRSISPQPQINYSSVGEDWVRWQKLVNEVYYSPSPPTIGAVMLGGAIVKWLDEDDSAE